MLKFVVKVSSVTNPVFLHIFFDLFLGEKLYKDRYKKFVVYAGKSSLPTIFSETVQPVPTFREKKVSRLFRVNDEDLW